MAKLITKRRPNVFRFRLIFPCDSGGVQLFSSPTAPAASLAAAAEAASASAAWLTDASGRR